MEAPPSIIIFLSHNWSDSEAAFGHGQSQIKPNPSIFNSKKKNKIFGKTRKPVFYFAQPNFILLKKKIEQEFNCNHLTNHQNIKVLGKGWNANHHQVDEFSGEIIDLIQMTRPIPNLRPETSQLEYHPYPNWPNRTLSWLECWFTLKKNLKYHIPKLHPTRTCPGTQSKATRFSRDSKLTRPKANWTICLRGIGNNEKSGR